jgi:hypothetical protein
MEKWYQKEWNEMHKNKRAVEGEIGKSRKRAREREIERERARV